MTDQEILDIAHRTATVYRHRSDPDSPSYGFVNHTVIDFGRKVERAVRAELAKPDDLAAKMSAVADQYAHKLALDLECVLADYSGTWYDTAISTLGAYRKAMNAIHERESPTFMGEPIVSSGELANHEKTSGSPIEDYSDCHGPDWTDRDGEYLK